MAISALLAAVNPAESQTWTQASASTNFWSGVACSADGKKLYACAGGGGAGAYVGGPRLIYASTDGGMTWTPTGAPSNYWAGVACSADGTRVLAAASGYYTAQNGGLYTSIDSGVDWTSNQVPAQPWTALACSADGSKLFAVTKAGRLFLSLDYGTNWESAAAPDGAWTIACSADGTRLIAALSHICLSTNSGLTWSTNTAVSSTRWWSVASSAEGKVLAAVDGAGAPFGRIVTSTNFGESWITNKVPLLSWQNIALSADGTKVLAAAWHDSGSVVGPVYTTTNSGATWLSNALPALVWEGTGCSADGNRMVLVSAGTNLASLGMGRIFTLKSVSAPRLDVAAINGIQISWVLPSTDYVVKQSLDLSNWMVFPDTPVLNLANLHDMVTISASNASGFFRLGSP